MFEEISTRDIVDLYISLKPDSTISKLSRIIGLGNVVTILECDDFKNKLLYLPRTTSLMRFIKPLIIRKRLEKLTGDERKEAVKKLSNLFGISARVIEKMYESGKYFRT